MYVSLESKAAHYQNKIEISSPMNGLCQVLSKLHKRSKIRSESLTFAFGSGELRYIFEDLFIRDKTCLYVLCKYMYL